MWYPKSTYELTYVLCQERRPNLGLANLPCDTDLIRSCGDLDLRGYRHELKQIVSIEGDAYLSFYPHELEHLTTIGRDAHLSEYTTHTERIDTIPRS